VPSAGVPRVRLYQRVTIETPSGLSDGTSQRITLSRMARVAKLVSLASRYASIAGRQVPADLRRVDAGRDEHDGLAETEHVLRFIRGLEATGIRKPRVELTVALQGPQVLRARDGECNERGAERAVPQLAVTHAIARRGQCLVVPHEGRPIGELPVLAGLESQHRPRCRNAWGRRPREGGVVGKYGVVAAPRQGEPARRRSPWRTGAPAGGAWGQENIPTPRPPPLWQLVQLDPAVSAPAPRRCCWARCSPTRRTLSQPYGQAATPFRAR